MDRAQIIHDNFLTNVAAENFPPAVSQVSLEEAGLSPEGAMEIFRAQVLSRQIDRVARKLSARGQGYYTIGSSGHEGNAAIAWALRPNDMAFLHYRDAAFQIARSRQVPGQTPLWDLLLSLTASAEDPISGGRHKVLGSKALAIPPQTSTIASHLPKAVGAAFSINLSKRVKSAQQTLSKDSIIACSFGDASLNHSTAQGAINTASWTAYQKTPLPLLFICEDNGIGISVKTPPGWVEASIPSRPAIKYFRCSGLDFIETYAVSKQAADYVRARKRPVFLHMSCVRLYGHAGADVLFSYLSKAEVETTEANDPLLHSARRLIEEGIATSREILDIYTQTDERVNAAAEEAVARPSLETSEQVQASVIPPQRSMPSAQQISAAQRRDMFGAGDQRALDKPQHMAKLINFAMTDLMIAYPEIIMAGQDIGRKGGVYGVTQKLQSRFGQHRIIDTLLDEQSILGLAMGLAHNGFIAVPEIQFLAYVHNAEDQIRGEAATLSFFSDGQFTNPMVVRIAGLGYQRGFGGHFHNDNSLAVLRDIPGLIIACPSNGRDAVLMMRECVRLAREEQRIVVFIEPIALYMTRDLHDEGDGGWAHTYPTPETNDQITVKDIGVHGDGTDLAIVSYANGYYLSRQAAQILKDKHGIDARVIDIRWIAPLAEDEILDAVAGCTTVLIVDECRKTGSQSEALHALFTRHSDQAVSAIAADDCFIPTGPSYGATMPSRDDIISAALALTKQAKS